MSIDKKTLKAANEVFIRFVTDFDARLRYGQKRRQEIMADLEKGQQPSGYRFEFLQSVARGIFGYLAEEATKFNEHYPQDRISVQDLEDILSLALAQLKK